MKRIIYITVWAVLIIASSCTASKELATSRSEKIAVQRAMVVQAIESDSYIIKMDKLYGRGGFMIQTNPSYNYITINHDMARINLGYLGRSWGLMKIAGINFSGAVIDKRVITKENNTIDINLKVKKNSDVFTVNMTIGKDGYCDVSVIHPKIDYTRYRGQISQMNRVVSEAVR